MLQCTTDPLTILESLPLDPAIEAQIDEILPKLTLEQRSGTIADNSSVTPEEVKKYRLGSVLRVVIPHQVRFYANTNTWVEMADAYFEASIDTQGVEIAIPIR